MGGWIRTFRTNLLSLFPSPTRKKREESLVGMLVNRKRSHCDFTKRREPFVQGQQFTSGKTWFLVFAPVRVYIIKCCILRVVYNSITVVFLKCCKFRIIAIRCSLTTNKIKFSGKRTQFLKYISYYARVRPLLKYVIQQALAVNLHILLLLYISIFWYMFRSFVGHHLGDTN